jgi:peptidoglycan/LPS O-acetylase OafA/YrhL
MNNMKANRFENRSNSLGFLRLLFASFVIISHVPEIYDGNRDREILSRFFGTISLGDLAVDAFFIISGYLVVASFNNSASRIAYMAKRIARVYPGFLVAYLMSVFVVAPLVGAAPPRSGEEIISVIVRGLLLQTPVVENVFDGTWYPLLNQSMWTISYEFRCYVLVLVLGVSGWLERWRLMLLVTAILLLLSAVFATEYRPSIYAYQQQGVPDIFSVREWVVMIVGGLRSDIRLGGLFLSGVCFYLIHDRIVINKSVIMLSAVFLVIGLCFERGANAAVAIFGGLLIFGVGNIGDKSIFVKINNRNDVSYGLYLYAWPVTKLLMWFWPGLSAFYVGILTFCITYACGWISWVVVERPVLSVVKGKNTTVRSMPASLSRSLQGP